MHPWFSARGEPAENDAKAIPCREYNPPKVLEDGNHPRPSLAAVQQKSTKQCASTALTVGHRITSTITRGCQAGRVAAWEDEILDASTTHLFRELEN